MNSIDRFTIRSMKPFVAQTTQTLFREWTINRMVNRKYFWVYGIYVGKTRAGSHNFYLGGNATLAAEKKTFDNFFYAHSKSNTKFILRLLLYTF